MFSKNTRKVFCPNCGNNENVNAYKSLRTASQRTPILWKDSEERELKRMFDEGLMPHQIAIHLGRSTGSVREKLRRMGLWKRRVIG
jgi:DNA-binding NarL/FixJ family response regulator